MTFALPPMLVHGECRLRLVCPWCAACRRVNLPAARDAWAPGRGLANLGASFVFLHSGPSRRRASGISRRRAILVVPHLHAAPWRCHAFRFQQHLAADLPNAPGPALCCAALAKTVCANHLGSRTPTSGQTDTVPHRQWRQACSESPVSVSSSTLGSRRSRSACWDAWGR
jgi:hypothetical protein